MFSFILCQENLITFPAEMTVGIGRKLHWRLVLIGEWQKRGSFISPLVKSGTKKREKRDADWIKGGLYVAQNGLRWDGSHPLFGVLPKDFIRTQRPAQSGPNGLGSSQRSAVKSTSSVVHSLIQLLSKGNSCILSLLHLCMYIYRIVHHLLYWTRLPE